MTATVNSISAAPDPDTRLRDLQAFCGVLRPVFEREYQKHRWNWEGKRTKKPAKK
jgi:hypothetical protein